MRAGAKCEFGTEIQIGRALTIEHPFAIVTANPISPSGSASVHTQVQPALFDHTHELPDDLPRRVSLRRASGLLDVFEDCHNYIYANEGFLKDKIFNEFVKILVMKFVDERRSGDIVDFGITRREYKELIDSARSQTFETRVSVLFADVRRQFPTLFPMDATLVLRPLSLGYIFSQLQSYNLSATPGDVKGEAFQTFIYRHQRGDRGEFFTPHPIVRLAVGVLKPRPGEVVLDPASGSGGFLIECIRYVAQSSPGIDLGAYVSNDIRGVEFNPDVARAAMVRLVLEGGTGAEIACADSLGGSVPANSTADIILTNPPFGSKGRIDDGTVLGSYELGHKWIRASADRFEMDAHTLVPQTPEVLFVERSLRALRPGGRMAIVVPEGLLQNSSMAYLRWWIRSKADVLAVVSLPQETFIPYGTGIKTSVLFLKKRTTGKRKSSSAVFMARVISVGYDVKGRKTLLRDEDGNALYGPTGEELSDTDIDEVVRSYHGTKKSDSTHSFRLNIGDLNSRLDVEHYLPADRKLVGALVARRSKALSEIATIVSARDSFREHPRQTIRYIAISDIDSRLLAVSTLVSMKAYEAPSRATYRLKEGDIVTAVSGASTGGPAHATAVITAREDGAICSSGLAVVRDVREIDPLYLAAFMRTDLFLRQVRRMVTGHAIPAISLEDLGKVLVPMPARKLHDLVVAETVKLLDLRRAALAASDAVIGTLERAMGSKH